MDKYIIVTKIPPRQNGLFTKPAEITIDEAEGESATDIQNRTHVPLGGYCMIINKENINWVVGEKAVVNKIPTEL